MKLSHLQFQHSIKHNTVSIIKPYLSAYARLPLNIARLSIAPVTGSVDPQAAAPLACLSMEFQCVVHQFCDVHHPAKICQNTFSKRQATFRFYLCSSDRNTVLTTVCLSVCPSVRQFVSLQDSSRSYGFSWNLENREIMDHKRVD